MSIVGRDRIRAVINCGWWQATRVSMKGMTTADKLMTCQLWLENDDGCGYNVSSTEFGIDVYNLEECSMEPTSFKVFMEAATFPHYRRDVCGYTERRDQILNYLTALSRGGLIAPILPAVYLPALKPYGTINFSLIEIRR